MIFSRTILTFFLGTTLGFAGAANAQHKPTTTPKGSKSGDLCSSGAPIAIPKNANNAFSKRSLAMYLQITTTKSGSIDLSPGALQAMKNYIESELPRLKRFKVYSVFNDGARRLTEDLQDLGDVEYQPTSAMSAPDLHLNISIDIQVEFGRGDAENRPDEIYYRSVMSVGVADGKTNELIAGQNFEAKQSRLARMAFNPATRKKEFSGGFDPNDLDNQNKVLQQLTRKQLINLALFLGREYPITCNVTTLSRTLTRFGGDQGHENGLRPDVDMVIWGNDDGLPTALAAASIEPVAGESSMTICRWNIGEPDAGLWIEEIKGDRKTVSELGLMATTSSMPLPEEWKKGD